MFIIVSAAWFSIANQAVFLLSQWVVMGRFHSNFK